MVCEVKDRASGRSGPYELVIKDAGSECLLNNVMLGEVWICSGQSNMSMPMKGWENQPILGGPDAIADANISDIRFLP